MAISENEHKVEYRPGKENLNSDPLSRVVRGAEGNDGETTIPEIFPKFAQAAKDKTTTPVNKRVINTLQRLYDAQRTPNDRGRENRTNRETERDPTYKEAKRGGVTADTKHTEAEKTSIERLVVGYTVPRRPAVGPTLFVQSITINRNKEKHIRHTYQ